MSTKHATRGRPPKVAERRKAAYLDIRLEASEKQAFRDAAEVAGLDLSAWVRERLRNSARRELEATGQPVAFLARHGDRLTAAKFEPPSKLFLAFADGFSGAWDFTQLGIDMRNMKLATISVAASHAAVKVMSKWNDEVELDASALRAAVDPRYAARLQKSLLAIRGPLDDLITSKKT